MVADERSYLPTLKQACNLELHGRSYRGQAGLYCGLRLA
eukprot:COSAG01_NODE_66982_length_268_cov_0.911243_1_plen_38_part_10